MAGTIHLDDSNLGGQETEMRRSRKLYPGGEAERLEQIFPRPLQQSGLVTAQEMKTLLFPVVPTLTASERK